jgi:hypothetical protein
VLLNGLQVLNAWFFAVVAGVGLTLFQHIITVRDWPLARS